MNPAPRLRRAADRGASRNGWLDSRHTFSFAHFHDPDWMGFGAMRVLNDDRVDGGGGFAPHRHANMEIISIVLEGALAHLDSTGSEGVIRADEVQWMSAGSGIEHSEFNASTGAPVHFLQIWIQPDRVNAAPRHMQRAFPREADGAWQLLVAPDAAEALPIRQDARIRRLRLAAGQHARIEADPAHCHWVQCVAGEVDTGGIVLADGDGIGWERLEAALTLQTATTADVLHFSLPR